ncbi:1-phosphofructokinase family hexose kinase [Propionicicella superfundia]|uniref:1-phosphofructokinase family hexose kinase n=1 Tax=Propionicicella superfundia TaxID=348582 RepID=UPI00041BD129|nr:1-phosphofructokinase family hexose kinase [Propionicicella superfundia]
MIVTVTPNPSLDRSAKLPAPLVRGGVHRLGDITVEPGGKGVNIARAVHMAGRPVLAVVPADRHDPLLDALRDLDVPFRNVEIGAPVRTNLTLTEPDGTTTKLNEPGAPLTAAHIDLLTDVLVGSARNALWVTLSGSLPPQTPVDWYPQMVRALRPLGVRVAVDTSDAPLEALARAFPEAAPHLVKPNSEELGQLTGMNAAEMEERAAAGDLARIRRAAADLNGRGVEFVLVTLGGAGALLSVGGQAWHAAPPPTVVKSTVGAGDSSLAGFLLAHTAGSAPADCLRSAVAYGSAAAALPGSALPGPGQADPEAVTVTALDH